MTPDDVTTAIIHAILRGGMQWVVSTVAAMLPSLWAMTVILHLARPHMLRTIKKLSLRFGADIWWLGYVLVRDALMLITFVLTLVFLFPNLMVTIPLPLTAPLAGLLSLRESLRETALRLGRRFSGVSDLDVSARGRSWALSHSTDLCDRVHVAGMAVGRGRPFDLDIQYCLDGSDPQWSRWSAMD